ncbi:AMP dependent coa ligase [Danaus plexippus plexippus]|uniref:AMP dependent coa ligase n=1 Tax=Danaus plexippus plexippus TaxID=278856 RepID=A0A212ELD3_DANPL|nr:AMP dependent coa ligase [Danaus plexippus plexippus]
MPNSTLYDYVWMNLDKWPERTLSVCAVSGRGYTYEQAFILSNNFAANLRKKIKLRDGDAVIIMLPNIPDFPLVALGILEAGGVISTVNPLYTAHEVHRQILMSDAKVIVTLAETVDVVRNALRLAKMDIPIIVVKNNGDALPEGTVAFNELSEDIHVDKSCLKEVRRTPKDICFLPYSSGTTGLPKGVELTNSNIIANCEQLNEPSLKCNEETTATHQDIIVGVLPFFHIYGATVIMFNSIAQGLKIVTLEKFQPDVFIQILEKHKINILYLAPPLVLLMINHSLSSPERFQYLKHIINGAAPVASSDIERLLDKIQRKIRLGSGYGLSETSPVIAMADKASERYDIIGNSMANTEMKIVNEDLKALGPNQLGELLVRGPQVMRGYRNNPESNASAFTDDGWFRTGDLATVDESGRLKIADRLKELIKVKGFQVPPAELEALLRDHPAVFDAAVIGVPHPTNGESPKAFVALRPGANVNTKELCDFVSEKVASYKRIDDVVILDSIPRSAAGKILRKDLKAKYC